MKIQIRGAIRVETKKKNLSLNSKPNGFLTPGTCNLEEQQYYLVQNVFQSIERKNGSIRWLWLLNLLICLFCW